jgi:splicing factor 3A subunit 1
MVWWYDSDIIKLTAQYIAKNGRTFLVELGKREGGNRQFAFLQPTHQLFPYFQSLVEAYTTIVQPPKQLLYQIKDEVDDHAKMLDTLLSQSLHSYTTPSIPSYYHYH